MFSFKGLIERANESGDLPKSNEPLNCAFQRRTKKKILCGLTQELSNLDPCLIDICPMYQTWKLLKEKK